MFLPTLNHHLIIYTTLKRNYTNKINSNFIGSNISKNIVDDYTNKLYELINTYNMVVYHYSRMLYSYNFAYGLHAINCLKIVRFFLYE